MESKPHFSRKTDKKMIKVKAGLNNKDYPIAQGKKMPHKASKFSDSLPSEAKFLHELMMEVYCKERAIPLPSHLLKVAHSQHRLSTFSICCYFTANK